MLDAEPDGDASSRCAASPGASPRTHVRGSAGWTDPGPTPRDLDDVRARCPGSADGAAFGRLSEPAHLRAALAQPAGRAPPADERGSWPCWRPRRGRRRPDRWGLHPAMLDEATSFAPVQRRGHTTCRWLRPGRGARPAAARFWSHLRYRDSAGSEVSSRTHPDRRLRPGDRQHQRLRAAPDRPGRGARHGDRPGKGGGRRRGVRPATEAPAPATAADAVAAGPGRRGIRPPTAPRRPPAARHPAGRPGRGHRVPLPSSSPRWAD